MRKTKTLLALLCLAAAWPAASESTRFWQQNSFAHFEKGTARGVALRSDGEILLAPRFRERADPDLQILWAVAEDGRGRLYLAGGSPAKVLRVDAGGHTEVVFESQELEVHALAADPTTGTLFLATSPDGKVYRLPPEGEAEVFFTPDTKYLWDLARHSDGTLYLATGDKGKIFRITPEGQGEAFFSSEETHIRSLTLDARGTLYAGTEPNGLVLRISPQGEAFVLYEMPRQEVTDLILDPEGNLYVAAIGRKARAPLPTPPLPTPPTTGVTTTVVVTPNTSQAQAPPSPPRLPLPVTGGSDIYRLAPDGQPAALWTSAREIVYALAFGPGGRLLAGTGNKGKLLAIDSPLLFTHLAQASSQQVTALVRTGNGRVYVGTANPGKLFQLGAELESEGAFESDVFDAELFSQWGRIAWQSRERLAADGVRLFTRSGNTSDPQKNWSSWSEAYADASGTSITSPPARFLQWKAVLRAVNSHTPALSQVSVAYLRRNVAPRVKTIIVQKPGIAIRTHAAPPQQAKPVQLNLPTPANRQAHAGAAPAQSSQSSARAEPPPQGTAQAGARSVLWSAEDENGDQLAYAVYYRGEGETRWKRMAEDLPYQHYTWDADALPDGAYYLKVIASDVASNPPDRALQGENVSDRFEIDNTPPRIDALAVTPQSRTVQVRFVARDSYSPLKKAEYSVNAGAWKPLFPASGTTDARQHSYSFLLKDLDPGEYTVVVRVYDRFENPALAKTTLTVP